jgi:hypothetical protein
VWGTPVVLSYQQLFAKETSTTTSTNFPGDRIPSHSRNARIPQPFQELNTGFHSTVLRFFLLAVLSLLLIREGVPFGNHTCANEENVSSLWSYLKMFAHGNDDREGDGVC